MPFFKIDEPVLTPVHQANFASEKELQVLIESNLETVFNCRYVATEFSTGAVHAGRIDTLALSEDNNPVIIEYKKVQSSELINQSLFYLHWLQDHHGDFEIVAKEQLGADVIVDWSDSRVICLAPNYKKYDILAAQVMGANIELWRYRLFENKTLLLDEVLQRTLKEAPTASTDGKNPVMVEAGRKAAITRATGSYSFDEHVAGKPSELVDIALSVREYIGTLDSAIEEVPKKYYVAYKGSQNIVCMEIQQRRILLYLKLDPTELDSIPSNGRDVSQIGHYGTGDLELSIRSSEEFEAAIPYIDAAYLYVGG